MFADWIQANGDILRVLGYVIPLSFIAYLLYSRHRSLMQRKDDNNEGYNRD